MVMYLGQIVEMADVEDIYEHPYHPYTKKLFESVITEKKREDTDKITVDEAELGNMTRHLEVGCTFYNRCKYRTDKCLEKSLQIKNVGTEEKPHWLRCVLRTSSLQED
jgi:oligopeptide/dipeptide ABC transporter ATP-binding protein